MTRRSIRAGTDHRAHEGFGGGRRARSAAAALALLCVAGTGARSARADGTACSFELRQGEVVFHVQMPATSPLPPQVKDCLGALGRELDRRPSIRSVTVAARLPAAQRAGGTGLAIARHAADSIVEGGVDAWRVSAVAPATHPGEAAGLHVAYRERQPTRPVARLQATSGQVETGSATAKLERARHGALLYPQQLLRTGPRSYARLLLADGSYVRVAAESLVRVGRIDLDEDLARRVELALLRGSIETIVRKGALRTVFNVLTRTAIAGVRGTDFRTHANQTGTRIETLDGEVSLTGKLDSVVVGAGRGSRVGVDGFPERTRSLPAAPVVVKPLRGPVAFGQELRWEPVPGAASYIVEIARDAEFSRFVSSREAHAVETVIGTDLAAGKWFWRVAAVDADGFVGATSKVYAFGLVQGH